MKANTNREGRLNFDRVVDAYEAGRPVLPLRLVEEIMRTTGLAADDSVLEIGAATGQLTRPLRAAGLRVAALEPGARLRERLTANLRSGDGGLTVHGDLFEDYPGDDGSFAAVLSANAFHWVDPGVSYAKAARLLRARGHLVLLWTYPILSRRVQAALNASVLVDELASAAWDPDHSDAHLAEITAAGRAELVDSGAFEPPRHWWSTQTGAFEVDTYVCFLTSFGNVAAMDDAARGALAARVRGVLADLHVERLEIFHHLYTCVARRRA